MGEITPTRLWGMRLAYFALALTIVFFHLIPMNVVEQPVQIEFRIFNLQFARFNF